VSTLDEIAATPAKSSSRGKKFAIAMLLGSSLALSVGLYSHSLVATGDAGTQLKAEILPKVPLSNLSEVTGLETQETASAAHPLLTTWSSWGESIMSDHPDFACVYHG
jgi:hypothetical protein